MVSWRERKPCRGVAGKDSGSDISWWVLQAGTHCWSHGSSQSSHQTALSVFLVAFGGMEGYREPFADLVGKTVRSGEWL